MSYGNHPYLDAPAGAARPYADERAVFIRRVYAHLAGATLALIGLVTLLLNVVPAEVIARTFSEPVSLIILMVLFIGAGFVARVWAQSRSSPAMQYLGLALYVSVWAVMFLPILLVASRVAPDVIPQAGILTACVFGGLTTAVFVTRKDFSFLGPALCLASWIALGVIVCAMIFQFQLGLLFSFVMVALVSGYILYDTSNVMRHYPTDMHVAASLELFADVALLFFYILRILLASSSRD